MRALTSIERDEELWERWLTCRWVRDFERGRCSEDDFATGVVTDWDLPIGPDEFLDLFRTWPESLLDGATSLVTDVRRGIPVGCLTNTNSLHWDVGRERFGLDALFDHSFASHELGLVKPDVEIFEHIADVLEVAPERVFFLDDNEMNVAAAGTAGWSAVCVRGVDEARDALVSAELV